MSKKENDIFEELFRDKLYDYEAETHPDDWEMIASRLPESKPVIRTLRHRWKYAAAAVIAGLMMITGTLYITNTEKTNPQLTDVTESTPTLEKKGTEEATGKEEIPALISSTPPVIAMAETPETTPLARSLGKVSTQVEIRQVTTGTNEKDPTNLTDRLPVIESNPEQSATQETAPVSTPVIPEEQATQWIADASQPANVNKAKTRRWGFGMGGGSLTAGAGNVLNAPVLQNMSYTTNDKLLFLNAPTKNSDLKTNVKHKTPVTVGMSASYYLNDRFSLQSGLSYTMLTSDWETTGDYHTETRQRLHFIGIPVSLSYKIAEWNRLRVYASTGFMPELNVSGKVKSNEFADNELIGTNTEDVRIKPLYWSVNARGGVSYPIIKYVNAFAEVGAAYYFDNGTEIETVRSEKPFNVSFNFGLRLGF